MKSAFKRFQGGGDSATGRDARRLGNVGRGESCARNGKWIRSLTAIVAPLRATLVRGAFVLIARARPASLSLFDRCLATAFAPKPFGFVFSHSFDIGFGPEANSKGTERLSWRYSNSLLSNPAMKRIPTDANQFCGFNSRIFLHLSITTVCLSCQPQKRTRTAHS